MSKKRDQDKVVKLIGAMGFTPYDTTDGGRVLACMGDLGRFEGLFIGISAEKDIPAAMSDRCMVALYANESGRMRRRSAGDLPVSNLLVAVAHAARLADRNEMC